MVKLDMLRSLISADIQRQLSERYAQRYDVGVDTLAHTARIEIEIMCFFSMNVKLKQLGQDLEAVFKKHGIEIKEGSLELKEKPFYRNEERCIVRPIEITFDMLISYAKRRIDGTYDDIYV